MAPVNGFLVSPETAIKIRDLLGRHLHASRFGNTRMERDEVLVKCLSEEPVGTGFDELLYDAELVDANTYFTDGGDQPLRRRRCWLSVIDNDEVLITPVANQIYLGRLCGEHAVDVGESHPDERPRVLATPLWGYTDHDSPGVISLTNQTIGDGSKAFQSSVLSGYDYDDNIRTDDGKFIAYTSAAGLYVSGNKDDGAGTTAVGGITVHTTDTGFTAPLTLNVVTWQEFGITGVIDGYGNTVSCVLYHGSYDGSTNTDTKSNDDFSNDETKFTFVRLEGQMSGEYKVVPRYEIVSGGLAGTLYSGMWMYGNSVGPKIAGGIVCDWLSDAAIADLSGGASLGDAITAINSILAVLRESKLIET